MQISEGAADSGDHGAERPSGGVIGLALGALLRRTAAGLSVFAAVFLVVPLVTTYLPQGIKGFAPYLPSNAAEEPTVGAG